MADKKISALTEFSGAVDRAADWIPITDGTSETKKISLSTLMESIQKIFAEETLADGEYTGIIITKTVDTNAFGVGAALYCAADGHYDTTDADAFATMPCTALALATGTGSKMVLLWGVLKSSNLSFGTVGGLVYVSTTVGALTQTAPSGSGDQIQVVGIALAADEIFFCPSMTVVEHV